MGFSFSKGIGKGRISISSRGVHGSMGLGGGLRVGTKLANFESRKKKILNDEDMQSAINERLILIGTFVAFVVLWKIFM